MRFRLQPTPAQEAVLLEHCAHARYVWNLAVEQHLHWRPGRASAPGYGEQSRQLTEARREFGWLAAGSQTVQQQALRDFAQAMAHFFAGTHRRFTFRLDDDDALCATYIDEVLTAAKYLPDKTVISFDDGYWFYRNLFGPTLLPKTYPFIAIGLGYLCGPGDADSVHTLGPHTEMGQGNNVHHVTGKRCWLRTVHDANDSRARRNYLFRRCLRGDRLVDALAKDSPHIDACRAGLVL